MREFRECGGRKECVNSSVCEQERMWGVTGRKMFKGQKGDKLKAGWSGNRL